MYSCFHSVGLHTLPLIKMLERVNAAGYLAVELNAETLPFAQPHVTPETSAQDRTDLMAVCQDFDLKIEAIGAKTGMVSESPACRSDALKFVNVGNFSILAPGLR